MVHTPPCNYAFLLCLPVQCIRNKSILSNCFTKESLIAPQPGQLPCRHQLGLTRTWAGCADLGWVCAVHLKGEAPPCGFCPRLAQLSSEASSVLPVAFSGSATHYSRNSWGCCLGLCLASAKVRLSGRMKGKGALAEKVAGGGRPDGSLAALLCANPTHQLLHPPGPPPFSLTS